jgi:hypothetical protein
MKWKGVEGSRGLIWGTISAFAWKEWEKSRKPEVRIACVRAEIWTRPPEYEAEC